MRGRTRGIRERTTLFRLLLKEVCAVLSLKRLLDRSLTATARAARRRWTARTAMATPL
jgi:hypothetical protein